MFTEKKKSGGQKRKTLLKGNKTGPGKFTDLIGYDEKPKLINSFSQTSDIITPYYSSSQMGENFYVNGGKKTKTFLDNSDPFVVSYHNQGGGGGGGGRRTNRRKSEQDLHVYKTPTKKSERINIDTGKISENNKYKFDHDSKFDNDFSKTPPENLTTPLKINNKFKNEILLDVTQFVP